MLRIRQQYDLIQETLQMREDMSAMIVHDLRNPMINIACGCELLIEEDLETEQKETVEQIFTSSQRLLNLVDDLLVMAKMESGTLSVNKSFTSIHHVFGEIINDFEPIINHNSLKLITNLPGDDVEILVDVHLFRRLIENLLSNAIKFSPEFSEISVKVDNISNLASQKTQIQIIDRGYGVKDELKQSIFKKYETGNNFKNIKQTGLGLAFCKMVVDAHDGLIFVEDNQPQGAIFTVQI